MKFLKIILLTLILTSCGNYVKSSNVRDAIKLCETNGGLDHLSVYVIGFVECKNGARFRSPDWHPNSDMHR